LAVLEVGARVDCAAFLPNKEPTLFHGTPIDPDTMGDVIRPHKAQSRRNGSLVNHGPAAAISTSTTLRFPCIRSLLHDNHPDLTRREFYPLLSRRTDAGGKPYIFTSAGALEILSYNKSAGFIYANSESPITAAPFEEREDLAEWRVPEPMTWEWVGRTSVRDLPEDLLVVDAASDRAKEFLDLLPLSYDHPLSMSKDNGIAVVDFATWRHANLSS